MARLRAQAEVVEELYTRASIYPTTRYKDLLTSDTQLYHTPRLEHDSQAPPHRKAHFQLYPDSSPVPLLGFEDTSYIRVS
jgi:hypothetical protein